MVTIACKKNEKTEIHRITLKISKLSRENLITEQNRSPSKTKRKKIKSLSLRPHLTL